VGSVVYDMVMESAGYAGPLRAWRAAEISVAAGNRFMCCRCHTWWKWMVGHHDWLLVKGTLL